MDEKQLIEEISGMFREQSAAMMSYIDQRIAEAEQHIVDSEQRIMLTIENDITKRLDTLTDGYQLVHEKQWEFERRLQRLEKRLDELTA